MLKLAVSSCLLGNPVRYDGRAKPCPAVLALAGRCELIPFCPECGCGLGCPREPMNIVEGRLLTVETGIDHTARLEAFAAAEIARLIADGAAGFVLKARSPSCGLTDTPHYDRHGNVTACGAGVFARLLAASHPEIPAADENTFGKKMELFQIANL